ncbi:FHA domain-containing protein [Methylobacillus gramineus]|uniref:FHA domain-containing protein n=1 Tax=Methylobacillus gramineus TaxID=755169 RepID=UPI001D00049E|nr:FHA domain-containing protein [Methylobacillus gramineus]MCB5185184.1 FHA domain-containing protein [Methylobacillus gramineus]
MAKLVLTLEGDFLAEFPLDKERLTIGRRPNNDIRLENLAISGEHAVVVTAGDQSYIEDAGSTNGTLVNGQPVKQHWLQDGDRIGLGRHQIEYREEGLAASRGFEQTILVMPLINQAMADAAPEAQVEQVVEPSETSLDDELGQAAVINTVPLLAPVSQLQSAKIQVLSGASAGKQMVLHKSLTTLGKSGVQVAVITRRPHGYFLAHVEGEGRPVLNGHAVGVQAHALGHGDIIELAGVRMEFSLSP